MKIKRKTNIEGLICASIAGAEAAEIVAAGNKAAEDADLLEIRLDSMSVPEVASFAGAFTLPLLFTNRASWEGGSFDGDERARVALLKDAALQGAAYIDIELKTEAALRDQLLKDVKGAGVKSIVSWHNFSCTPSSQALLTILQEQYRTGADIGKIVTMARDPYDVLRLLDLQVQAAELAFPLIAFTMGDAGVMSRVATLGLGGYMTYGASSRAQATAPGQLSVAGLRRIMEEVYGAD